jgi:hypothetical protein
VAAAAERGAGGLTPLESVGRQSPVNSEETVESEESEKSERLRVRARGQARHIN